MRGDGRREQLLGESEIPRGAVLPIGPDFSVQQSSDGIEIRFKAGSVDNEIPDLPVGALPLVVRTPEGRYQLGSISVPPPKEFGLDGIDAMWKGLCAVPPAARGRVRRSTNWAASARHIRSEDAFFLPALPHLLSQAQHLMSAWPQRDMATSMWRSTGLVGGREDVRGTVREFGRLPAVAVDGRYLPARTLRSFGGAAPWRLWAAHDLALMTAKALDAAPAFGVQDDRQQAVELLTRFAMRARPKTGARDVPQSSWPHALRHWVESGWRVFSQVQALGRGVHQAPLCNLYELFEAWTVYEIHQFLESKLGEPSQRMEVVIERGGPGQPAWFSRWVTGDTVIELWSQHAFGRDPVRLLDPSWGPMVRSVTTDLIPDVLLIVGNPAGFSAYAVDAKFTSKSELASSTASETGSKYHWGTRVDDGTPFLEQVVIASNRAASPMFDEGARISSVRLVPGYSFEALQTCFNELLAGGNHPV